MERVGDDAEDDGDGDGGDRHFVDGTASRSCDESGWERRRKPEAASTPSLHHVMVAESANHATQAKQKIVFRVHKSVRWRLRYTAKRMSTVQRVYQPRQSCSSFPSNKRDSCHFSSYTLITRENSMITDRELSLFYTLTASSPSLHVHRH